MRSPTESANPNSRLVWFDRSGQQIGRSGWSDYHHPWLASDETRVVVERTDASTGRHTIWILDVLRGVTSRLIADPSGAHLPVWSPDGTPYRVSVEPARKKPRHRPLLDACGWSRRRGARVELTGQGAPLATDWSLDGRYLLFDVKPNEDSDLWTLSLPPRDEGQPFLHSQRTQEVQGRFSPDTRWVAYASDESGTFQVYVRRFPGADRQWQVSTHGGCATAMAPRRKELFYLAPDGKLMVAAITSAGAHFETGVPRPVLDTGITGAFIDRRNQ